MDNKAKETIAKALKAAEAHSKKIDIRRTGGVKTLDKEQLYDACLTAFTNEMKRQVGTEVHLDGRDMVDSASSIAAGIFLLLVQMRRDAYPHTAGGLEEKMILGKVGALLLSQMSFFLEAIISGDADDVLRDGGDPY